MNFPTADMQAAFGDFLTVEAIRRHLERQRPELLAHMQHIEGRPLIGLRLPNGQQVVCARTQIGVMAGWACVTPACSRQHRYHPPIFSFFSFRSNLLSTMHP